MRTLHRKLTSRIAVLITIVAAWSSSALAADPPKLRELRVQQGGKNTYFHVVFDPPAGLAIPKPTLPWDWSLTVWSMQDRRNLSQQPRLVPLDGNAQAVYAHHDVTAFLPRPVGSNQQLPPAAASDLEFTGKCSGKGKAQFLLIYPVEGKAAPQNKVDPSLSVRQSNWVEVPVSLEFDQAVKLPEADSSQRKKAQPPGRDDLEGIWASFQAAHFALLHGLNPDFGFYSYACEATSRKYNVPSLQTPEPGSRQIERGGRAGGRFDHQRLYETTTGAAAIAESLQLERMIGRSFRDADERKIDIEKIPGIDIAEHPWKKMMGDDKPTPEPLAHLVPAANYYVRFANVGQFIDLFELIDQWGTSLARAYELQSRDYRLRQRYERQLCLRSTALANTLGPLVIRELAVTGSDGYLREGSDVTVLFHVRNRELFLAAVEPFLQDARKEWGSQLRQRQESYQGILIESFVTPLREVSLHRATLGDFVVYSNSPAAVRRIVDTQQGRLPALADALDFQYMRTIFSAGASEEGFAFLSDAFIRQFVGPASKIKEKRRLEVLTSLAMCTNDAMFTAWETGELPAAQKGSVSPSVLKPEEIYTPEGKPVTWDVERKLAIADTYGTMHFATPLIELPIDLVTATEQRDYLRFRGEYLGLWRRYFDPVGVRFVVNDNQIRIETYLLPLIQSTEYNELRSRTGDGTTPLAINGFSPRTIAQFVAHISPNAPERGSLREALSGLGVLSKNKGLDWLGDWFLVRFDDSEMYGKAAKRTLLRGLDPDGLGDSGEYEELLFQMPVTAGVAIRNPLVFAGVLTALHGVVNTSAPGAVTWTALEPEYKGVTIIRVQAQPNGMIALARNPKRKEPFLPAIYYTILDGAWYVSLRQDCIQDIVDRSVARKEGKLPKPETLPVNASLYLAPEAAGKTTEFVKFYLEMQTHRQALANEPIWYALHHARLVPPEASGDVSRERAFHYLGFVPVSPDGAPYSYEKKTDEIINERQGSLRQPKLHSRLAENAPLGRLLNDFRTLRADLRFREDGIHSVLTIERKRK